MKVWLWFIFFVGAVQADVELLIVGGKQQPVYFVTLPFTYHGQGLSPAVTVENHIVQALSSTGLFSMPFRYEQPHDVDNMLAWQLAGIRYVLQGEIHELNNNLSLILTISDTLGLQPTLSRALLNPKRLELSSQMFADQVYRSLFYATFTNDNDKQYLEHEDPLLTRYLNQLVMQIKNHWFNVNGRGVCQVNLQQLPGGAIFKHQLNESCHANNELHTEIEAVFERLTQLPYDNYQPVFIKNIQLEFIARK